MYNRLCKDLLDGADIVIDHNPLGYLDKKAQAVRYQRTLSAYREIFGVDAPVEFWPLPVQASAETSTATTANPSSDIASHMNISSSNSNNNVDSGRLLSGRETLTPTVIPQSTAAVSEGPITIKLKEAGGEEMCFSK